MRHVLSTAMVALVVGALAGATVSAVGQSGTSIMPAAGINADRVDGKHAVGAGATKALRAGKLVATNSEGFLPPSIVKPFWGNLQNVPAGLADGVDDGITGVVITRVRGDSFEIDANDDAVASVDCPAGSKAISGGFTTDSFGVHFVTSLATDTNGWIVAAQNTTANPHEIVPLVNCIATQPAGSVSTAGKGPRPATP